MTLRRLRPPFSVTLAECWGVLMTPSSAHARCDVPRSNCLWSMTSKGALDTGVMHRPHVERRVGAGLATPGNGSGR